MDIGERVRRLEDRVEINELVVAYFLASDCDDLAGIGNSFAEDATFSASGIVTGTGREGIVEFIRSSREQMGLTVHTPALCPAFVRRAGLGAGLDRGAPGTGSRRRAGLRCRALRRSISAHRRSLAHPEPGHAHDPYRPLAPGRRSARIRHALPLARLAAGPVRLSAKARHRGLIERSRAEFQASQESTRTRDDGYWGTLPALAPIVVSGTVSPFWLSCPSAVDDRNSGYSGGLKLRRVCATRSLTTQPIA